jgi:hypothetical protein
MGQHDHEAFEPETDGTSTAETDDLLDTLANADRRFVLAHLSQRETETSLGPLGAALAANSDDLSHEDARIALHHVHLPKLEAAGLLEYDDTIELSDEADASLELVDQL